LNITRSLFFSRVFLKNREILQELEVGSHRPFREHCIIKLQGIHTLDQAREFAGKEIWLPEEDLQRLEDGQYYFFQLIGCSVVKKNGDSIGLVKDVIIVKNNNLLVVEKGIEEIYIPFSESICVEINLVNKEIIVDPPKGLLELNEI
jgi:16S rRNA processing protein RimM